MAKSSFAQDYPSRPIRFVVPFPASGGGDIIIRALSQNLSERLGQAVVVTGIARSSAAPEIPTLAESGFPAFEASTWIGATAPAGLARPILNRLNSKIVDIMRAPDMRERLVSQGAEPQTTTPEQFAAYIKSENAKWAKIVRDTSIATQ